MSIVIFTKYHSNTKCLNIIICRVYRNKLWLLNQVIRNDKENYNIVGFYGLVIDINTSDYGFKGIKPR